MHPFFFSVDGGGSSTKLLVTDEAGTQLATCSVGATSFKSAGYDQAERNIAQAVQTLTNLGYPPCQAQAATWGLSGCDTPADLAKYRQILQDCGLDLRIHHVCNDSFLALYAHAQPPAIVVISGTGSIAYGVDRHRNASRAGGLGYRFSDLGSGCWMGAQLLEAFALHLEHISTSGIAPDDPGFSLIEKVVQDASTDKTAAESDKAAGSDKASAESDKAAEGRKEASPKEMLQILSNADEPSWFAHLAYLVLSAPEAQGSPLCTRVAQQGARYLAGYVAELVRRMTSGAEACAPEEITLVMAGGLTRIGLVRGALERQLARIDGIDPKKILAGDVDPVWGGIFMARERLWYEE